MFGVASHNYQNVPDRRQGLTPKCMHDQQANAYKKQEAPDWRPILSLILFIRAVLRKKSKGLPIDVPFYLLYFLHTQRRV
jgi:hypothetical protein